MKKKILIIENNQFLKKIFKKKLKKYDIYFKNFSSQKKFLDFSKLNNFYAIFCTFGLNFDKNVINNFKDLKYIVTPTTGTDHIDTLTCKNYGIKVISLKNKNFFLKNIAATAELTWAMILALSKNLISYSNDVIDKKKWNRDSYLNYDLKESSIGIIGYGRIGKIIEKYAKAFGMNIFIYETNKKKTYKSNKRFVSLKKVLSCNFITIHIPLKDNRDFFTKQNLKYLNKNSVLINTSRGDLFEERNFINFLKLKQFKGLGLDVLPSDVIWNKKLPSKFFFLKKLKKPIIVTPHIGGNTVETRIKTTEFIINCFLKS